MMHASRRPTGPSPHSAKNKIGRVVWAVVWLLLFRPSPRLFRGWRNVLLRCAGADIHRTARICPSARIWAPWLLHMDEFATIGEQVDVYCVDHIRIGKRSVVSQYSYLCGATHDFSLRSRPLVPLPITIGDDVWLAADVFVAPGVTISDGVVVGARSSVFKDLPAWKVCVGSPAEPIKDRVLEDDTASNPNFDPNLPEA